MSPWNTLRQDEDLRTEILQDVERCMPENAYFREPSAQSALLDILFVYCKLNRDIGYRQGMHEVLAPVVWVVFCDAIDSKDVRQPEKGDLVYVLLDPGYIEHDAFTLFTKVMQTVRSFYEIGNSSEPVTAGLLNSSPIVERSKRIHENYLHHADPELAEHLTAIEILPQIFLIRWIRLLFGREFPFDDVLALWDILFAEDPELELVDFISVSMLLRIRWQLLEADYTAALTLLLRYPVPQPPHGPSTFVSDALYLRDNLFLDGGHHIISKYSNKSPETTVTRKLPKKIRRARTAEQEATQNAVTPTLAFPQQNNEHRRIESILQDAAKGLYITGEKWGVAKALRGAVQGLQSTNASPSRLGEQQPRLQRQVADSSANELLKRIEALERRNAALGKMLEKVVEELWSQQKDKAKAQTEGEQGSDALGLAIAKVQFVQVYLENSSMGLPDDESSASEDKKIAMIGDVTNEADPARQPPNTSEEEKLSPVKSPQKPLRSAGEQERSTPALPKEPSTPTHASPMLRPSLSQSPYSWMLGEEQPKSQFVPSSPFQPDGHDFKKQAAGLFGDDNRRKDGEEDDDVFTAPRRKR
ncbi:uncharacterized protein KY384_001043 [Bacidia gigantensis]|uniref:uncharacterized protein n=1 Tax=Bacidia gigantensis TaxID=2732470 RepID=UPI001D04450C|nr:uncharacterized protein KY384_001043 [Bacidia gigantensis]KAG8534199.1 hypothetical protein KY384_001043 [Bacidia gigantensis]